MKKYSEPPESLLPGLWGADHKRGVYGLGDGGTGRIEDLLALARWLGLSRPWDLTVDIGGDPLVQLTYKASWGLRARVHAEDVGVSVGDGVTMEWSMRDATPADLANNGPVARWLRKSLHAVDVVHGEQEALWEDRNPD